MKCHRLRGEMTMGQILQDAYDNRCCSSGEIIERWSPLMMMNQEMMIVINILLTYFNDTSAHNNQMGNDVIHIWCDHASMDSQNDEDSQREQSMGPSFPSSSCSCLCWWSCRSIGGTGGNDEGKWWREMMRMRRSWVIKSSGLKVNKKERIG